MHLQTSQDSATSHSNEAQDTNSSMHGKGPKTKCQPKNLDGLPATSLWGQFSSTFHIAVNSSCFTDSTTNVAGDPWFLVSFVPSTPAMMYAHNKEKQSERDHSLGTDPMRRRT
ncbi:hypothetical protein B5S33_g1010 [[Candida] boidinii]|nr:hypothetical protein B5S30_g1042 [[Candida] boidinii]OWB82385.1 hypothetical protein B5S33_g1010 [[Candida] boidinii]